MFSLPVTNPWYIIFIFNPAKSYLWYINYVGTLMLMENISGVKRTNFNVWLLTWLGRDLQDYGGDKMILLMPIFSLTQTGCYGFVWHVFFDTGNSTGDVSSAVFYISSVFTANCQQYLIAGEKCWSRVAAMALWLLAISQERTEASPFPPRGLWLGRALSSRAPSSSRAKCDIPLATSQCQGPCPASGSHVGCSCEQGRW